MNKDKDRNKLLSVTTEFRSATLLVWLMPKTSQDYRDLSSDLLRVNLIFSNKNLMTLCTRQAKRRLLNPFISSFIGKELTLKTKLREFVILSKDKDTSFQLCKRLKIKWIKQGMVLMVPKTFGWKPRNNSEINLKFSIELIKIIWTEMRIKLFNLPCTCSKCSSLKRKLSTKPWIWWDYLTKHLSVISGHLSSKAKRFTTLLQILLKLARLQK